MSSLPASSSSPSPVSSSQSSRNVTASASTAGPRTRTIASTHWPTPASLLEVPGVDQVLAAGVGDLAVDDDDLAVEAKVEPHEEHADQAHGHRRAQHHAPIAEPVGLRVAPKNRVAPHRIKQDPADHSARRGP